MSLQRYTVLISLQPSPLASSVLDQVCPADFAWSGDVAGGADASQPGLPGPSASSVMSRAELWRQSKKARAAEWAAFNASRPDESYEAPADIAVLADAAATIGDYKLKSEDGYVLPEVFLTP